MIALSWLTALPRFLYKFLVGDDILVAVVMLAALVATGWLAHRRVDAWWLVPPLALAMTAVSLRRRPPARFSGPNHK